MKTRIILLLILFAFQSNAQNKKYISTEKVLTENVLIYRVPKGNRLIIEAQKSLDRLKSDCQSGVISKVRPLGEIQLVAYSDSKFPVKLYYDELAVYERIQAELQQNKWTRERLEREIKDSIIADNAKRRQSELNAEHNSPEGRQARLQASMKMMSKSNTWHDYLTVFTGELELNFSHLRLLDFLAEVMKMSEVSNDYEGNYIVSKCVQRTSKGNPEQLTIRYKVRAENGYFFPETVEITGTNRKVIELFISYWPSKIQYDETKKGAQYDCYYTPDKVTLSIDKAGKAKINIVNSQK
jgi:hypothetical protein